MPWKRMIAIVTGKADKSLRARLDYALEENRILRAEIERQRQIAQKRKSRAKGDPTARPA